MSDFINLVSDYLSTGYKGQGTRDEGQGNVDSNKTLNQQDKISDKNPVPCPLSPVPDTLEKIVAEIKVCKNCQLHAARANPAPGEGSPTPLVMVIGEGPGAEEDAQGRPFVGKAGQLLDKMLAAIGLSRNDNAFIANVVKCRPPNNRDPQPEETAACANFLNRQILLLKPKFILLAGRVAAQTLLSTTEPISKLRGKFFEYKVKGADGDVKIPVLATYHPAALLRNEELKRPAWEDLKLLKSKIDGNGE